MGRTLPIRAQPTQSEGVWRTLKTYKHLTGHLSTKPDCGLWTQAAETERLSFLRTFNVCGEILHMFHPSSPFFSLKAVVCWAATCQTRTQGGWTTWSKRLGSVLGRSSHRSGHNVSCSNLRKHQLSSIQQPDKLLQLQPMSHLTNKTRDPLSLLPPGCYTSAKDAGCILNCICIFFPYVFNIMVLDTCFPSGEWIKYISNYLSIATRCKIVHLCIHIIMLHTTIEANQITFPLFHRNWNMPL